MKPRHRPGRADYPSRNLLTKVVPSSQSFKPCLYGVISISATEATTAMAATCSVTPSAPRMSSFWKRVGYQSSVNPVQLKFRRSALNEKMIRMTIGRMK